MNLYIDESGSINNHNKNNKYFIIAIIHVKDKDTLKRTYKRFVSSNYEELKKLDQDKVHPKTGSIIKSGGKMFFNGSFKELKGAQFDRNMKQRFLQFFSQKDSFEVYYIKIANEKLSDRFCENTARVFNYTIRIALSYLIKNNFLPDEDCFLQLDERNEKTETRYFLENYLNTELPLGGITDRKFWVSYFDSSHNKFIQIADVFANLYYSHLCTGAYAEEFQKIKEADILKFIFNFPMEY